MLSALGYSCLDVQAVRFSSVFEEGSPANCAYSLGATGSCAYSSFMDDPPTARHGLRGATGRPTLSRVTPGESTHYVNPNH